MSIKEGQIKQIEQLQRELDNERTRRYELEAENAAAENECLEQCRLLAMGGEREARLMAENATLREDAEKYRWLRKFEVDSFFASGKENRLDKSIDAARKE